MAQLFIKNFQLFRRSYAVATENMKKQAVASVMRKTTDVFPADDGGKGMFWMRDPKTGNWIPENHLGDIDVAELREKLLPKNHK
ncbi:putative Pectinesterase-3 precursor [Hibiscus syriacus]|uniref:Pectinesterase-3 n=1 Tax=Hibiscus syriacus TaxID=106335 RepID=A0A6A2YBC2_HIBSY|nr:protein SENESCENCE-ASSOCIATED GENE 21, mitochondrial-like [Hibiscus syriacus]KAE8669747.1 putative Pectinesterase-3 precursor [Hibiscus syriacus]